MLALPAAAHEGEHHDPAAQLPVAVGDGARRIADDELKVPKSLQRLLDIRTGPVAAAASPRLLVLPAEVVPAPSSRGAMRAPQAGRLEAAGAWPTPGRRLRAGELIAWLRPLLTQRDEAQRRAQLADVEQKLQIARINAERLRVQAEATPGVVTNENVYREQAELELEAMQKRRELESAALRGRMPIRAPVDGVLYDSAVRDGEVVAPGQALFEIADARGAWLAVISAHPETALRLQDAFLELDGARLPLRLRGEAPLADGAPGWRLLFEPQVAPPRALQPGELLSVGLSLQAERSDLGQADYCVPGVDGVSVWIHVAPERFRQRRYASCAAALSQASPGERWVTRGAALLSQYR